MKYDSVEQRISKILQEAAENEDISSGFYKDLEYTQIDEDYLENLLKERKNKKWWRRLWKRFTG